MQKYLFLVFLLLFGISTAAIAQRKKIDSLTLKFKADSTHIYRPRKLIGLVALDQRNTFVKTSPDINTAVFLRGLKLGATIYQRHKTGFGIYRLRNSTAHFSQLNGQVKNVDFTFNYFTIFYEYYFIHTKTWDIGVPIEAGIGRYKFLEPTQDRKGRIFPFGTALDVHLKPMRWFSVNAMGGYRQVIDEQSPIELSNWFYAVGFSLNTRHIYQDARYYLKKKKYKHDVSKLKKSVR